jgi:hypothetical protein
MIEKIKRLKSPSIERVLEVARASLAKAINDRLCDCDDECGCGYHGGFELMEVFATLIGVPPDNTCESGATDYANTVGKWPEWGFCRDGLYNAWGRLSLEEFLELMVDIAIEHAGREYPMTKMFPVHDNGNSENPAP